MTLAEELQPDQQASLWDNHVDVYQAVFEPLTNSFARHAIDYLGLSPREHVIEVGCGTGGAAIIAAEKSARVLAVDISPKMIARLRQRAEQSAVRERLSAEVMDGMALALPDATFDAALSVFGVILFPDAVSGIREIARVLKPGGRAAIVTWCETERYELITRLLAAVTEVRGPQQPPKTMPAQLRFREPAAFRTLFMQAGLIVENIIRLEERWNLPSARWLADNMAFAPGMSAMIGGLGSDRVAVLDVFVSALEKDQGHGEVILSAVAHAGFAHKP